MISVGLMIGSGLACWAFWPMVQARVRILVGVGLMLSLGLYAGLGGLWSVLQDRNIQTQASELAQSLQSSQGMAAMLAQLKQATQAHPEDAQGWYWLGRMSMHVGEYDQAKQALAKAHALAPEAKVVTYHYALAIMAANHQQLNQESRALLETLAQDPQFKPLVHPLLHAG